MVREQVGPVASFRTVAVAASLPKTRSGKTLRRTIKAVLEGDKVLSTVSATKEVTVADVGVTVAPFYDLETSTGYVKASTSYGLGNGATVNGEVKATDKGAFYGTFDLELTRSVDGRELSAVVRPLEQEAELQVTDAAIGTLKAAYATGASPKLTLKRALTF